MSRAEVRDVLRECAGLLLLHMSSPASVPLGLAEAWGGIFCLDRLDAGLRRPLRQRRSGVECSEPAEVPTSGAISRGLRCL